MVSLIWPRYVAEVHLLFLSDDLNLSNIYGLQIVPGKEEFYETIRYFKTQLKLTGAL